MTVQAAIRGADYLRPDPDQSSLLSRVQDAAPLRVWAFLFIAAAALVAVGWVGRWGQIIAGGHMLAMVCYAAIGYGVLQVTGADSGVRTPSGLLLAGVIHGALGFSILATLRRREVSLELDDR